MNPEEWWHFWTRLCRRFGREEDQGEAAMYLEYIEDMGLGHEAATRAAHTLWASREFFPRPVDFVLAAYPDLLVTIRKAASLWRENRQTTAWLNTLGGKDSLGMDVVRTLGGIDQVPGLLDRGPGVFRREVEAHLELVLQARSQRMLPSGDIHPELPGGVEIVSGNELGVDVEALKP